MLNPEAFTDVFLPGPALQAPLPRPAGGITPREMFLGSLEAVQLRWLYPVSLLRL